jgi:type I restriction enzyme S subunit
MSFWKEVRMDEILVSANTGLDAIKRAPIVDYDSGTKCLRIQDISQEKDFQNWGFCEVEPRNYDRFQLKKGDIIVARTGATVGVNRFFTNDLKAVFNNGLIRLRTDVSKCIPKYLFYNLRTSHYNSFIESISGGTSTQPNMQINALVSFEMLLPPLPEQTAIAEVLSSLDDKIDLLHRQNKTLEQLAETLFRQWFVEEAEESWEVTTLNKHTEVFRGLSYKGSGLTEIGFGLPMHNLNSVYEGGGYKYEGIKFYNGEYRERHLVSTGDIIVTNTEQGHDLRLIGFPAIVPDYFGEKGLFSQHIYKLTLLENTYLTREFIYYLLMVPSVREQITGATNGSTVNMLAIDGLQKPEFKLPPKDKVVLFTSITKDYWIKKSVNQNQIRTLTQLRNTLLPKLMSGEVRVNN